MKPATPPSCTATAAKTGMCRRIALIAIMVAIGVAASGLGTKQVRAEPPDPCEHARCEF